MTVYLDTSQLVKLYLDEPGSESVRDLVTEADAVATSVLTYAEARAAIARRRREKLMTTAESRAAIRQLDADWSRFAVIPCDEALARDAGDLADLHDVRGADAIHLASFASLVSRSPDEIEFSCADDRLVRAAGKLGRPTERNA